IRHRRLLIHRRPISRWLNFLLSNQRLCVAVLVIPEPFARPAAERIIRFGFSRQGYYLPALTTVLHVRKQASSQVIDVPPSLDQYHTPAGLKPRQKIRFVPVPQAVPDYVRIHVLT